MIEIFKILWDLFVLRDAARKEQMNWRVWVIAISFLLFLYGTALPAGLLYEKNPHDKPLFIATISLDGLAVWRKLEGNSPDLAEPLNFLILAELATGHFAAAEQQAQEMVAVQTGKVEPSDRRFGMSHMLWARALAAQNRWREALPHAEIADRLLARNAVSVGAKQAAAEARQLLHDVQVHLNTD